ncbi:MAG: hypothetical protein WBC02_10060 [Candidatus Aminicenantaceae bacterium]
MRQTKLILLILFAVLPFLIVSFFIPELIEFKDFNTTDVIQLFALLILVSLFLERALEVFLSTWRGPGSAVLDLKIEECERKISRLKELKPPRPKEIESEYVKFEKAKKERKNYKCQSQRFILWIGLAFGFLVSAIGLQALHSLADPNVLKGLPKTQQTLFRWVDVLLTGGLIAGGSDGIHKIANVYNNFMNTTAEKAGGENKKKKT